MVSAVLAAEISLKENLRLNFTWSLASTQWQAGPSTSCHWKGRKEDKGTKKIIIYLVVLVHVFTYKFSLLD
jgi:hypothetical protein